MEPQLPTPHGSPENLGPAHFSGGEAFSGAKSPEAPTPKPEQAERHETKEQHTGGPQGDPAGTTPPVLPSLPQLPTSQPQPTTAKPADDTNPPAAADEDLIEKEWVEKAKRVVAETRHDPHMQEQAVSRLQADYLKKRYGKTVNLLADEQG